MMKPSTALKWCLAQDFDDLGFMFVLGFMSSWNSCAKSVCLVEIFLDGGVSQVNSPEITWNLSDPSSGRGHHGLFAPMVICPRWSRWFGDESEYSISMYTYSDIYCTDMYNDTERKNLWNPLLLWCFSFPFSLDIWYGPPVPPRWLHLPAPRASEHGGCPLQRLGGSADGSADGWPASPGTPWLWVCMVPPIYIHIYIHIIYLIVYNMDIWSLGTCKPWRWRR